MGRVCLPAIAQGVYGHRPLKPKIERLWRFTDNPRVEVSDGMRGAVARLLKKCKKRLLVAFDWSQFRNFHTLALVAVIQSRGVPRRRASTAGSPSAAGCSSYWSSRRRRQRPKSSPPSPAGEKTRDGSGLGDLDALS